MSAKIGVISLGCAKNRVDTETMMGALAPGFEFVQKMEDADVVIINTCSFINDAKEESINTILETEQRKKFGHLKGIIVTGCLTERYRDQLHTLMPRVDAFLGISAYKDIYKAVQEALQGKRAAFSSDKSIPAHHLPRVISTAMPTAYIKIAEGCDNGCSYCVIPQIRGALQSRAQEDIIDEMRSLLDSGYSELVLIAQDTTEYGLDLCGKPQLARLLDEAAVLPGLQWLRVLYCYPERITEELIDTMLLHDTIVKYIDMPLQHFDNRILAAMKRRNTHENTLRIVDMIRSKSADFILRTTLISGFPGETRREVQAAAEALQKLRFDRVGFFTYSQEEGTPAALLPDQVPEEEKKFRRDMLASVQSNISLQKNTERIGKAYKVLVEGFDTESGLYFGRSYAEAPESDGKIFIETDQKIDSGRYYTVRITHGYHYDLKGELF